jgi:methyltransferase
MLSQWLFSGLVLLVALQRVFELWLSRRHEAALLKQGAREHAAEHFKVMATLHALWLAAILAEVWLLRRTADWWLSPLAAWLFIGGQTLRYLAISTLGQRWTTRIYTIPGAAPVTSGIYRYLRHPNYLGVVLELAALPLMHGAWLTALTFSVANTALLSVRIREEERALRANGGYERWQGGVRLGARFRRAP